MYVAASSDCFPDLSLDAALARLVDLEYSRVEIALYENGNQLKPSQVSADLDKAVAVCRQTHRLTPIAYSVEIEAEGDEYYRQFAACCRLAKATKVVTIVVPAAELGTPFNAEVERLRDLVTIGTNESVVVAIKTQAGRVSQDPDSVVVLCDNVKGLGVTLDPSNFAHGENATVKYDQLLKYVRHVHLRDTSKDKFQVRVGQGNIEYGRLVTQLRRERYQSSLSVYMHPLPEVDHLGELRKLRLLLESLL